MAGRKSPQEVPVVSTGAMNDALVRFLKFVDRCYHKRVS